jgi:hypothetical protein
MWFARCGLRVVGCGDKLEVSRSAVISTLGQWFRSWECDVCDGQGGLQSAMGRATVSHWVLWYRLSLLNPVGVISCGEPRWFHVSLIWQPFEGLANQELVRAVGELIGGNHPGLPGPCLLIAWPRQTVRG